MKKVGIILGVGVVAAVGMAGAYAFVSSNIPKTPIKISCGQPIGGQVYVEGGTFKMGAEIGKGYGEEEPVHQVTLDGFHIDAHEVTNSQFKKFVEETDYVTVAERAPDPSLLEGAPEELFKAGSTLFTPPGEGESITTWWTYVPGTNWKHPYGPDSNIEGKDNFPVVHVAFEDAKAYADWAGRELPTEAQFEFAARSKMDGEVFAWGGGELAPEGNFKANTWQGMFPVMDTNEDGYAGLAPIGCFDANAYGAHDLIGNVWEWTSNWYAPKHAGVAGKNPKGPDFKTSQTDRNIRFPERVIKGGSFLCAPNYCLRYRPSARHAQDTGLGSGHIGFRTVLNKKDG